MIEVIKFGAVWCGPCKVIAPTINELKKKYDAIEGCGINIIDIDVDENPELGEKYQIRSIPTLIFVKDNEIVERRTGILKESEIEEIIKSLK